MSRLRVTDVDAVQQNGYLFLRAATNAHVRLCTDDSPLAYVHAYDRLQ